MRDFPRAGSPTITTQICVSSTWTPTPLVFLGRAISMLGSVEEGFEGKRLKVEEMPKQEGRRVRKLLEGVA